MSDMQLWLYLDKDRQSVGPIHPEKLLELATAKAINPRTYVWTEGLDEWIRAAQVEGLFVQEPAADPAPVKPAAAKPVAAQPVEEPSMTVPLFTVPLEADDGGLKRERRSIDFPAAPEPTSPQATVPAPAAAAPVARTPVSAETPMPTPAVAHAPVVEPLQLPAQPRGKEDVTSLYVDGGVQCGACLEVTPAAGSALAITHECKNPKCGQELVLAEEKYPVSMCTSWVVLVAVGILSTIILVSSFDGEDTKEGEGYRTRKARTAEAFSKMGDSLGPVGGVAVFGFANLCSVGFLLMTKKKKKGVALFNQGVRKQIVDHYVKSAQAAAQKG